MSFFEQIASRLKWIRVENKISRKKLSIAIDTKERTIESYELGERKPTLEYIEKVADYFNVHPSFLLGSSDCAYQIPSLVDFLKAYMEVKQLDNEAMSTLLKVDIVILQKALDFKQMTSDEILDILEKLSIKPSELKIDFSDEKRSIVNRYFKIEYEGMTLKQLGIKLPQNKFVKLVYHDAEQYIPPVAIGNLYREVQFGEICALVSEASMPSLIQIKQYITKLKSDIENF